MEEIMWNIHDKMGEVRRGVWAYANRRESVISDVPLSSLCGEISDERSRDMAGLNKHRNQPVVTHAIGLFLTRDISH